MTRFLQFFRLSWFSLGLAVLLAGIIHVIAVFSMPHLVTRKAWDLLTAIGPTNSIHVLPAASPVHQSLPFMAPNVRYAVCRYDLAAGPVRLKTKVFDELSLIAFYTTSGANFYTISGTDIKRDTIEVFISTQAEPVVETDPDATDDSDNAVVVTVPSERGVVVIRTPLAGKSQAAHAEKALAEASCSTMVL